MNSNLKTKSAIYVMLNLISFMFLVVFGMALLGDDFFRYVGKAFHYVYAFVFVRSFDLKTAIALVILVIALACLSFWVIRLAKKDTLKLQDILFPVISVVAPFLVLAAYRGNSLGIFDSTDTLLVILTLVFLVLYVLTSILCLVYGFMLEYREKKHAKLEDKKNEEKKVVVVKLVNEKTEEPAKEETSAVEETEIPVVPVVSSKKVIRRPFTEKMSKASDEIKTNYNELKNELISYGVKSRISHGGDTFRLRKQEYAKITLVGKNLKLYLNIEPSHYEGTTIPYRDESAKKCFAETPTMIKVKSPLSIKRAKMMIADVMANHNLTQGVVGNTDYAKQLKAKKPRVAKK